MLKGFSSALLHFLGGEEHSKGAAGGFEEGILLDQQGNRDIVKQTVSDVIADRKIKKEKRNAIIAAHESNIDALRNNNYNFENAVSIAAAGQTDNYIKYANEYGGNVDDLWKFTGNIAGLSGLTTREVAERLTGPLIYSDIQYGDLTPSTGILAKLGIAPNLGKEVQQRVNMLAPIDPADAEMKKLLVSGEGTKAVADLEATAPRSTTETIRLAELMRKWSESDTIDPTVKYTSRSIPQGGLSDSEWNELRIYLAREERDLTIPKGFIGSEMLDDGGPATDALVAKLINIYTRKDEAKKQGNQQRVDELTTQFDEEFNNLPEDVQTLILVKINKLGY